MDLLSIAVVAVLIALCEYALYKNAIKVGFGDGYLSAIKDLCDGAIVVDGRNLTIGNDAHMRLFQVDDGRQLTSLDMDKLDIH